MYSTATAAAELDISPDYAKRLCQDKTFRFAYKFGERGPWVITEKDIREFRRAKKMAAKKKAAKKKVKVKA